MVCIPNFSKDIVEITDEIFENTGLIIGTKYNILANNNRVLIGPVELARANEHANLILYIFSIKDVDFIKKE